MILLVEITWFDLSESALKVPECFHFVTLILRHFVTQIKIRS